MNTTNDQKALLNIFPREVWTLIMGNVKTAKDYQKICGSSSFLESFLQPRCTQILFPDVAKLLVEQYLYARYAVYSQEVRNSREVCRAWKIGTDHVLQNPISYSKFPSWWTYAQEYENEIDMEHFDMFESSEDIKKFQEHYRQTHSLYRINPFVCRGAFFTLKDDGSLESYYFACAELLELYGHHVWYCNVHFNLEDEDEPDLGIQLECYKKFAKLLELMPNLKALEFLATQHESAEKFMVKTWKDQNDAASQIHFPHLRNLHYIELEGMPLPIVKTFVQMNSQVNIVKASYPPHDKMDIYLEQLPNLTRLAIDVNDAKALETLRGLSANCKIIALRFNAPWTGSWNPIFDVLETQLGENLRELTLFLPIMRKKFTRGKGLTLPNLKTLDLRLQKAVPIDFLLEVAPTLEELFVTLKGFGTDSDPEVVKMNKSVIKLYSFWKTPYKSNVWSLFPKLQLLRNQLWSVSYLSTRADWEKYQ